MSALLRILSNAARTGIKSPRSITAAAVTGSLISSHNAIAATGASTTALTLRALNTRGQKRLFGAGRGRSIAGVIDAIWSESAGAIASTVPVGAVPVTRSLLDGYERQTVGKAAGSVRSWD